VTAPTIPTRLRFAVTTAACALTVARPLAGSPRTANWIALGAVPVEPLLTVPLVVGGVGFGAFGTPCGIVPGGPR